MRQKLGEVLAVFTFLNADASVCAFRSGRYVGIRAFVEHGYWFLVRLCNCGFLLRFCGFFRRNCGIIQRNCGIFPDAIAEEYIEIDGYGVQLAS